MPIFERILSIGITGSGKSWQWMEMAARLQQVGATFRVIDTDNDVMYMMASQFPELLPENGGRVYVCPAYDWPEYKLAMKWALRRPLKKEELERLSPELQEEYKHRILPIDWVILDMCDSAWKTVQSYFTNEVFGEDPGDYFLKIRHDMQVGQHKGKKEATSTVTEGFDGWKDWSVINKLYDDWIKPVIYQAPCHVYATSHVDKLDPKSKETAITSLFGAYGIKPTGQKELGQQFHTIFLMLPGRKHWYISTIKDRAGRSYFEKTPLTSLYTQYLVAKGKWAYVDGPVRELPVNVEEGDDEESASEEEGQELPENGPEAKASTEEQQENKE